jgi:hypothetical protein
MREAIVSAMPVRVADRIAGYVVEDKERLRFVAADRRFGVLDGSRFWHLRDVQRAADRLARVTLGEQRAAGRQPSA